MPVDPLDPTPNILRAQQSQLDSQQRAIDDINRLLVQYRPELISAFDTSGIPAQYQVLTQRAGSWLGITGGGGSSTPLALQPGADVSTNANPKYTITYGKYGGVIPTIGGIALDPTTEFNIITLGPTDTLVYVKVDFTFTGAGTITIVDAEIMSGTSLSASTITGGSGAGGSGTLYDELFGVTITAPVGSGPYTVAAAPAVGGSQNFGVCLTGTTTSSISGPWGV